MALLQAEKLIKSFGGLMALCEVNFEIHQGEIFGVIGPNGSGKTTLFNVITGFLKANAGKVTFMGKDITGFPPHQICRQGIARIFQIVAISPIDNPPKRDGWPHVWEKPCDQFEEGER